MSTVNGNDKNGAGKKQTYYAGGTKAATIEWSKDGKGKLSVDTFQPDRAMYSPRRTPSNKEETELVVESKVEAARREFDDACGELLRSMGGSLTTGHTEYQDMYIEYPKLAYLSPRESIPQVDHFSFDFQPEEKQRTAELVSKPSEKPWAQQPRTANDERVESEYDAKFKPPPQGWQTPKPVQGPPESIDLEFHEDELSSSKGLQQAEIENLRNQFDEEISRIHRHDLPVVYESEYDSQFRPPNAVLKEIEDREKAKKPPELASEYQSQFQVRGNGKTDMPAAGVRTKKEEDQNEIRGESNVQTFEKTGISEYQASFTSPMGREIQDGKSAEPKPEEYITEYSASYSRDSSKPSKQEKNDFDAGKMETEYIQRYSKGADVADLDPGFLPSPKRGAPKVHAPFSEYQAEYDHLQPHVHEPPLVIEPHLPMVSEYEASYGGVDVTLKDKELAAKANDLNRKIARNEVKPAYALPPGSTGDAIKHRLFDAEINPGYVQRTEYMNSYQHPKRKENIALRSSSPTAPPARKSTPEKSVPNKNGKSKDKEESNFWERTGKALRSSMNPISRYPRFNPFGNLFKTPTSTYRDAFRAWTSKAITDKT